MKIIFIHEGGSVSFGFASSLKSACSIAVRCYNRGEAGRGFKHPRSKPVTRVLVAGEATFDLSDSKQLEAMRTIAGSPLIQKPIKRKAQS